VVIFSISKVVPGVRNRSRLMSIAALAGLGVLALATPAAAHVEVSADKKQAGAADVTLTFHGEGESDTAGIVSERVVLPPGIAPADVTLVKAPAGWKFTPGADGFTIAGKALPIGADAEWKVKIKKLPAGETRLPFKTLETYGDGQVARWIEVQREGGEEPASPAPMVILAADPAVAAPSAGAPSAGGAPASAPAGEASGAAQVPSVAATALVERAPASDDGGSAAWWIVPAVVLVLFAGGAFALLRRRKEAGAPTTRGDRNDAEATRRP
jgi:hypothetical protein